MLLDIFLETWIIKFSHVGKIACQTHLVKAEELSMFEVGYLRLQQVSCCVVLDISEAFLLFLIRLVFLTWLLMSQAMYKMHQRLKLPFALESMPLTVLRTFSAFVVHSHKAELKGVACATVQEEAPLEKFNRNLIPCSVASKSMIDWYTIQYGNLDHVPLFSISDKDCACRGYLLEKATDTFAFLKLLRVFHPTWWKAQVTNLVSILSWRFGASKTLGTVEFPSEPKRSLDVKGYQSMWFKGYVIC